MLAGGSSGAGAVGGAAGGLLSHDTESDKYMLRYKANSVSGARSGVGHKATWVLGARSGGAYS